MIAMEAVGTGVQGDPCFHNVPAGMDPNFVYFSSAGYSRTPCTVFDMMTPGSYTVRKADTTWTSTRSQMNTSNVFPPLGANSITWDRFHNLFIGMAGNHHSYAITPYIGAPWTVRSPIDTNDYQFQSLSPSFLGVSAATNGRVIGVSSLNGPGSNQGRFEYLDLGPANPTWGTSQ
jgi:hypothetical protein